MSFENGSPVTPSPKGSGVNGSVLSGTCRQPNLVTLAESWFMSSARIRLAFAIYECTDQLFPYVQL